MAAADASRRNERAFLSQSLHGIVCRECVDQRTAPDAIRISGAAVYAMEFIVSQPMNKLYTFTVNEQVLKELERCIHTYVERNTDRKFKSLQVLEVMK